MKRLITSVFGAVLLLGSIAASAAEIAGNVTLATDYRFRGISQLKGDISPAIQGGFDLEFAEGFYVGTWGSNVNFSGGAIELDYYGGYGGKINDELSYDIGMIYYDYPRDGSNDYAYYEFAGSLSWKWLKVGLNYSPDYFAETDDFYYPYVDASFDYDRWSFSGHFGYNSFKEDDFLGNDDYYYDYSVGVTTDEWGVTWGLSVVGTNLDDDSDCFGDEDLCSVTLVGSISKSL